METSLGERREAIEKQTISRTIPISFFFLLSIIFLGSTKLVCVNNCPLSSRISIRNGSANLPSVLPPSIRAFRRSGNYFILLRPPPTPPPPSPPPPTHPSHPPYLIPSVSSPVLEPRNSTFIPFHPFDLLATDRTRFVLTSNTPPLPSPPLSLHLYHPSNPSPYLCLSNRFSISFWLNEKTMDHCTFTNVQKIILIVLQKNELSNEKNVVLFYRRVWPHEYFIFL